MSPLIDRNGCRTQNPKWKRWDRWLIQRYFPRSHTYTKQWKVVPPIDPVSDYCDVKYFKSHVEALEYANRCWIERELLLRFEEFLCTVQNPWMPKKDQHNGLDTMIRYMHGYKDFNFAEFMENL
jgi:hypothetical protein